MKRIGGLFEQIPTAENLARAAHRAALGKQDRAEVREFFRNYAAESADIVRALADETYMFSPYRSFPIRDPKSRTIHAPPFRDRVVHHAILAVTGLVFEKGATAQSYACRTGKGGHAALDRVRSMVRRTDWFLKIDVAKYYDSIPHEQLLARLHARFREAPLQRLFQRLLASYAHSPGRGLPIGAYTSQFLANFFLDSVDHFIQRTLKVGRYARYMDDMLLLSDPTTLRHCRRAVGGFLESMGLRMKNEGVLNRALLGIPWLGFTAYPDRTRLNAPGRKRLRRKLKTTERAFLRGALPEAELQMRATSLLAHAQHADDIAWRRDMLAFLPSSLLHHPSRLGEAQGPEPRPAWRLLEQHGQELPLRLPQQEQAAEPQQELRIPPGFGPRHGDATTPPDDAPSRAQAAAARDETTGKPPPAPDSCPEGGATKAASGAPDFKLE